MKTVLITGISGFAGSFLAEHIASFKEFNIVGTTISNISPNLSKINDQITLKEINLIDAKAVLELIKEIKPDFIYHLAALSAPSQSFDNPSEIVTNNISAQINLLEAVRSADINNAKILITSSADIYGLVEPKNLPIDENTPFMPTNSYAVSKLAQDFLALQYFLTYKMNIVRVRPFNHIGPRQSPNFVVSKFAKEIAEIEKGLIPPVLYVGSLDAKRDFTDVRDMVRCYVSILDKGIAGEVYNIGSGVSYKIRDILNMLLAKSSIKIKVENDQALFRPADNPELICNSKKVRDVTNWKPEISLEKTLMDTLDYWRKIV